MGNSLNQPYTDALMIIAASKEPIHVKELCGNLMSMGYAPTVAVQTVESVYNSFTIKVKDDKLSFIKF